MQNKSNTNSHTPQPFFAGLDNTVDHIEFYGIPETKDVRWLQHGVSRPFNELPPKYYVLLINAYTGDKVAKKSLEKITDTYGRTVRPTVTRQTELYTYYCWGDLDGTPDIINGVLQPSENFRHDRECISLSWKSKDITIKGIAITPRELKMLDHFAQDDKDEVVAIEMGITRPTLNYHKKRLYDKVGVHSKPALMMTVMQERIVQSQF